MPHKIEVFSFSLPRCLHRTQITITKLIFTVLNKRNEILMIGAKPV